LRKLSNIEFHFSRLDRDTHENSYTLYLGYEGPLPATARGKEIKVDITIKEKLIFPLVRKVVLRGYEEYADLPDRAMIPVYYLSEIAIEKVSALADQARNEPRDLYDLSQT
jgi:predicted nucleotidyltransferase component of viral defense system